MIDRSILFCILLFAGIVVPAGEACPRFLSLTIHDRQVSGVNFESARTPVARTSLQGDTLDVDIQTELAGKQPLVFSIPEAAGKIRLFGCEYQLPPPDHTAYFRSVLMIDIRPAWWRFEPDEMQRAMMLVSFAPDRKTFDAQIWYYGQSGKQIWKWKRHFSCVVADDGQIFERRDPEMQAPRIPGILYQAAGNFKNPDGKLHIRLETTGRFYKCLKQKKIILHDIDLPKPDPCPDTLFFLNLPFREKYLAENQAGNFEIRKSVAELHAFAGKIKLLRFGMMPEETAAVLGKPDHYVTSAPKGPNVKPHAHAEYDFLYAGQPSMKNLSVSLHFEKDPSGIFRLKDVD